jgi:hypothetical protein
MLTVSEYDEGDVVSITGVVVEKRAGRVMLWVPGIGESGRWEITGTASAEEVTGSPAEKILRNMAMKLVAKVGP